MFGQPAAPFALSYIAHGVLYAPLVAGLPPCGDAGATRIVISFQRLGGWNGTRQIIKAAEREKQPPPPQQQQLLRVPHDLHQDGGTHS